MQRAEGNQYILFFLAKQYGSTEYRQQVVGIELSDETYCQFVIVEVEQHSLEMRLQDFAFEVAKTTQRVGVYLRTGILRHHKSVLVIQVGQAESSFWQFVEELFLGFEVVLHRFMIIQMVAGQISENTAGKLQTADALLGNGMGTDFHEGILAAGICHFSEQAVQGYRVRGGVFGRYGLVVDVIAYSGNQSDLVAEIAESII